MSGRTAPDERLSPWHQAAVLAGVTLAVFAPTLSAGFVYDARLQILTDPFLHDPRNWRPVLTFGTLSLDVWLGTSLTAGVPLVFLLRPQLDGNGMPVPAWKMFWSLFGASNQLLAALTLLGVTVWLWRTWRAAWVWLVTGLPTAFMYVMSTWALAAMTLPRFRSSSGFVIPADPVPWAGVVLLVLAAVMLAEAIRVIVEPVGPSRPVSPSLLRRPVTP